MAAQNKISRRALLAGGIATLTGAACVGLGKKNQWGFLNAPQLVEEHWSDVTLKHSPLSMEMLIDAREPDGQELILQVQPEIKKDIDAGNLSPSGWQGKIYRRQYASAIDHETASHFQAYALQAIDFLHSRLAGLEKLDLKWEFIQPGRDYSDSPSNAFIGSNYYDVTRIDIISPSKKILQTYGSIDKSFSAITQARHENGKAYFEWMFLSRGPSAIASPIAEYVHANTQNRQLRYSQESSYHLANQADEALAEGIAQALVLDLVKELNIPNGEKILAKSIHYANPYFAYVPDSTKWIKTQGPSGAQKAYGLYMESPQKFMEAILAK
jgi:hypothetical protein